MNINSEVALVSLKIRAKNESSPKILNELASNNNPDIRAIVAANPNIDAETFNKLMNDKNFLVINAAIKNYCDNEELSFLVYSELSHSQNHDYEWASTLANAAINLVQSSHNKGQETFNPIIGAHIVTGGKYRVSINKSPCTITIYSLEREENIIVIDRVSEETIYAKLLDEDKHNWNSIKAIYDSMHLKI